ncbi:hypothetical protein [Pseudoalteromonas sp.]|uniref:hypothetical protein n=1 Tax=Pseudoalteromonas sp. TaxID=53249 RepID=UPI003D142B1A
MINTDILDVSDALDDWLRPTLIKKVTKTTVDFEPDEIITGRTQDCMIQVAQPEQLIKMQLDISLRHIRVHSKSDINMKELVEFEGKDFRVITPAQWSGYGYVDVMAVETKEPLKIAE